MAPMYPDHYPCIILRLGDLELAIRRIIPGGYNRTRAHGAEVDYSIAGTPVIKGRSHVAKYLWQITALLDYQECKLLKAIAEQSDLLMQSPPYEDYEVTLSDVVSCVTELSQTRGLASYFLDDETLGCVSYFAQFRVVIPLQSIEETDSGAWFQVTFQMVETTIETEDAPDSQLEPPSGGNPPSSGGFNVPILLGQLPSEVITSNNIGGSLTWSNISGKPDTFPGDWNTLINKPTLFSGVYADLTGKPTLFSGAYSDLTGKPTLFSGAWSDLTGKPSTFPSNWATLGGIPDLAYQGELDTVSANLYDAINAVSASLLGYLPLTGGTMSGPIVIPSGTNQLILPQLATLKIGDEANNTNNFWGELVDPTNDTVSGTSRIPLVISHHTGISFSAYAGRGGTRFFAASEDSPFNYNGTLLLEVNSPRSRFFVPLSLGSTGLPNAYQFEVSGDSYTTGLTRVSDPGIYGQSSGKYLQHVAMTYGSWRMIGNTSGWNGLSFFTGSDNSEAVFMAGHTSQDINTLQCGVYVPGIGWNWYGIGTTFYAGTYANISDERMKSDMVPLGSMLETIREIVPLSYKWAKGKGDNIKHTGFSAQQFLSSPRLAYLVRSSNMSSTRPKTSDPALAATSDNEQLSVVYTELIPLLVKALQELDQLVQATKLGLEGQINALTGLDSKVTSGLSGLTSQLSALTSRLSTNENSIATLTTRTTAAENQLNVLTPKVNTLETQMASQTAKNNAQDTQLAAQDARIKSLEDQMIAVKLKLKLLP